MQHAMEFLHGYQVYSHLQPTYRYLNQSGEATCISVSLKSHFAWLRSMYGLKNALHKRGA
jgi:hypothetical protein